MAPGLVPYDDIDAAIAGARSPWVRSLDGPWQFRLRALARRGAGRRCRGRHVDRRLGRGRRAVELGAAGRWRSRPRRADLPQRADAVRRAGAARARRQPDRRLPAGVLGAGCLASSPHAAARRGGELDGLRVGQRHVRRVRHRQPPRRRRTTSPTTCAAAPTRCASSCRGGARRRGWRTRTSGGCPGCIAASSSCPCRRSPSATRRQCPGSNPTARPGRSTSTSLSTSSPARIPSR